VGWVTQQFDHVVAFADGVQVEIGSVERCANGQDLNLATFDIE
jgi:hypothetical protein